MIKFRDETAKKFGLDMIEYINQDGVDQGINPFDHGSAYTDIMKTQDLKTGTQQIRFHGSGLGAVVVTKKNPVRRNVSSPSVMRRTAGIRRTSVRKCGNFTTLKSIRVKVSVFSHCPTGPKNDIWQYIKRENIDIVSLYFAAERPVVYRDGNIIMVDDDRFKLLPGEKSSRRKFVSVP